ncbi:MAG TPA: CstA-like transporter-associated (seleno)protein [Candidatus Acidoferrales bacterium]|nr:CstA-like transporter-associated (seleno)protein [Candidatus Acidoferrales bacterium]
MSVSEAMTIGWKRASLLRLAWSWLRQVSGDAEYENYLRCARRRLSAATAAVGSAPLSRAEFYLDSLRRRYSTVSRCC